MILLTLAQSQTVLPEGGMVSLAVATIAGLALWLAGVKIVRAVFISIGAAVGGFVGAVLIPLTGMPTLHLGPVTVSPGFAGLLAGGVIGALIALGMLRVVVAVTAAGAFAVAGALAALIFLHLRPTGAPESAPPPPAEQGYSFDAGDTLREQAANQLVDAVESLNDTVPDGTPAQSLLDDLNTEENRQKLRDAAERSRRFVSGVADRVRADYESRPARDKLILLSATMAGLGLGLVVGAVMPKRSAALVTSLSGSAMWLAAGVALVRANTDPTPGLLDQPPVVWGVLWGVATVVGMAVQFGLLSKKGSKPSHDDEDDDD